MVNPSTLEPDGPATIEVAVDDLVVWKAAFNSAYNQNTVLDLAEHYRKMATRPRASAMTKALEGAVQGVDAYITAAKEAAEDG